MNCEQKSGGNQLTSEGFYKNSGTFS